MKEIVILAAVSDNNVIGKDGALPWYIPEDLKRFKSLTLNHPVIMGRKTYESIVTHLGKPLNDRLNIVLSRQSNFTLEGVIVADSISASLDKCRDFKTVYIIGGQSVYEEAFPLANTLEITEVHKVVEGDTFFPEIKLDEWVEKERVDKKDYSFVKYLRL